MILEVKGDLNLLISQVNTQPESSEQVVLVLDPGTGIQVQTREEACALMPSLYEPFVCIEDFVRQGLALSYRPDQALRLGNRTYLIGQAVVCRDDEDGNLWSLTGRDICQVMRFAREHSTLLCVDGKYNYKKAKAKYRAEHESELRLFYRARRILKEAGMPPEFSQETVDAWRKELALLQDERAAEYAEFKPLRDEQQKMSHIQYCVNRVIQPEAQTQEKQKTNTVER